MKCLYNMTICQNSHFEHLTNLYKLIQEWVILERSKIIPKDFERMKEIFSIQ